MTKATQMSERLGCDARANLFCDQDARQRGVFVPLFGTAASTPKGAAQVALRLQVPFLPVFGTRLADGRHRIEFQAPIEPPPRATEEEAVRFLLASFNARLETVVRRDPSQYWWAHRRWKTQPAVAAERRPVDVPRPAARPC